MVIEYILTGTCPGGGGTVKTVKAGGPLGPLSIFVIRPLGFTRLRVVQSDAIAAI